MIDWEAVSAVAGALGTLGVLVTLLYLAKQIKDNSKLLATSIYESAMSGFNDLQHLIAANSSGEGVAEHGFRSQAGDARHGAHAAIRREQALLRRFVERAREARKPSNDRIRACAW